MLIHESIDIFSFKLELDYTSCIQFNWKEYIKSNQLSFIWEWLTREEA